MTTQEYTRWTGMSYTTKFTHLGAAIEFATNEYNLCKTKVIMLEAGVFGVMQNSLVNRLLKAGYERAF